MLISAGDVSLKCEKIGWKLIMTDTFIYTVTIYGALTENTKEECNFYKIFIK